MRRAGLSILAVPLALATALACAHAPSGREREAAEIHYQLGAEALQAGRREDAMREFDEALRSDERHAAAHLGRVLRLRSCRGHAH